MKPLIFTHLPAFGENFDQYFPHTWKNKPITNPFIRKFGTAQGVKFGHRKNPQTLLWFNLKLIILN
jgi:hypothetical protein